MDSLKLELENLKATNKRLTEKIQSQEENRRGKYQEQVNIMLGVVSSFNAYFRLIQSSVDDKTRAILLADKIITLITIAPRLIEMSIDTTSIKECPLLEDLTRELDILQDNINVEGGNLFKQIAK